MVLRASGVEKAETEGQFRSVAGHEHDAEHPRAGLANAALLFPLAPVATLGAGSYITTVLSLKATMSESTGLRSIGLLCAAFYVLLHFVLQAAAVLRVFSIQRLPRGCAL